MQVQIIALTDCIVNHDTWAEGTDKPSKFKVHNQKELTCHEKYEQFINWTRTSESKELENK